MNAPQAPMHAHEGPVSCQPTLVIYPVHPGIAHVNCHLATQRATRSQAGCRTRGWFGLPGAPSTACAAGGSQNKFFADLRPHAALCTRPHYALPSSLQPTMVFWLPLCEYTTGAGLRVWLLYLRSTRAPPRSAPCTLWPSLDPARPLLSPISCTASCAKTRCFSSILFDWVRYGSGE